MTTCPACGQAFTPRRRTVRYCSRRCAGQRGGRPRRTVSPDVRHRVMTLAGLNIPVAEIARRTGLTLWVTMTIIEPARAERIDRHELFSTQDVAMMLGLTPRQVTKAGARRPWLNVERVGKRRYYREADVIALREALCPQADGRVPVVRLARRAGVNPLTARRKASLLAVGTHAGRFKMLHVTPAEWAQVAQQLGS